MMILLQACSIVVFWFVLLPACVTWFHLNWVLSRNEIVVLKTISSSSSATTSTLLPKNKNDTMNHQIIGTIPKNNNDDDTIVSGLFVPGSTSRNRYTRVPNTVLSSCLSSSSSVSNRRHHHLLRNNQRQNAAATTKIIQQQHVDRHQHHHYPACRVPSLSRLTREVFHNNNRLVATKEELQQQQVSLYYNHQAQQWCLLLQDDDDGTQELCLESSPTTNPPPPKAQQQRKTTSPPSGWYQIRINKNNKNNNNLQPKEREEDETIVLTIRIDSYGPAPEWYRHHRHGGDGDEKPIRVLLQQPATCLIGSVLIGLAFLYWNHRVSPTAVAFIETQVASPHYEHWRAITGVTSHFDLWHIGINTMSLLALGKQLETDQHYGSIPYLLYSLSLIPITKAIYVGIATHLVRKSCCSANNRSSNNTRFAGMVNTSPNGCVVGYSGILFAWMVVASLESSNSCPIFFLPEVCFETTELWNGGFRFNVGPLVQLVVTQMLLPRVSFVGHLSGVVAGFGVHWNLFPLEIVQPTILFPAVLLVQYYQRNYITPIDPSTICSSSRFQSLLSFSSPRRLLLLFFGNNNNNNNNETNNGIDSSFSNNTHSPLPTACTTTMCPPSTTTTTSSTTTKTTTTAKQQEQQAQQQDNSFLLPHRRRQQYYQQRQQRQQQQREPTCSVMSSNGRDYDAFQTLCCGIRWGMIICVLWSLWLFDVRTNGLVYSHTIQLVVFCVCCESTKNHQQRNNNNDNNTDGDDQQQRRTLWKGWIVTCFVNTIMDSMTLAGWMLLFADTVNGSVFLWIVSCLGINLLGFVLACKYLHDSYNNNNNNNNIVDYGGGVFYHFFNNPLNGRVLDRGASLGNWVINYKTTT